MARTRSITNEQILEAARELFLERGMTVTTAEIARCAGVSEGTIFRRFPTKEALFHRALGIPKEPEWFAMLDQAPEGAGFREYLIELGEEILVFFQEFMPRMMAFRSCGEQMFSMDEPPPVRAIKGLSSMLQKAIERGQLQNCEPEMVARTYLGSMSHYAVMDYAGINKKLGMDVLAPKAYVRGVVSVLWGGIAPTENDG